MDTPRPCLRINNHAGIGATNALPVLSLPNLRNVEEYFFLQYLENLEVLELPLLNSTGTYFIVSAADSLAALELPSFTHAGQTAVHA